MGDQLPAGFYYKYSGDKSKMFWGRINALKSKKVRRYLYTRGCHLQNIETEVLRELWLAEESQKSNRG